MKTLLAAIDFSQQSSAVAEAAVAWARAAQAELYLLHVAEPDSDFVGDNQDPEQLRGQVAGAFRREHRQLQELAQKCRAEGIEAHAIMAQGPAVSVINSQIEKLDADAVIVGQHCKGALASLLLGSVAEHLIRHAKVPVLVVPAAGD